MVIIHLLIKKCEKFKCIMNILTYYHFYDIVNLLKKKIKFTLNKIFTNSKSSYLLSNYK
jgi:hypothetical protein